MTTPLLKWGLHRSADLVSQNPRLRVPEPDLSYKKFNWCPVTPIFREIKPFGEHVEGHFHSGVEAYTLKSEVQTHGIEDATLDDVVRLISL